MKNFGIIQKNKMSTEWERAKEVVDYYLDYERTKAQIERHRANEQHEKDSAQGRMMSRIYYSKFPMIRFTNRGIVEGKIKEDYNEYGKKLLERIPEIKVGIVMGVLFLISWGIVYFSNY